MKSSYINVVATVSGAAILAVAITGIRLLAPFYGVSLNLWTAVLCVTLAGLAVGFIAGGRTQHNPAAAKHLLTCFAIAGIWIIIIPYIKHFVFGLAGLLGLRASLPISSAILFFPPITLLGMVFPIGTKLQNGSSASNLYAIAALAGVVSVLLTGFHLIPYIGVTHTLVGTGLVLLLVAIIGSYMEKNTKLPLMALQLLFGVGIFALWIPNLENPNPDHGLKMVRQSEFSDLRVIDTDEGRFMMIDGGVASFVDTTNWISTLHYNAVSDFPRNILARPSKLLLIGLGSGSIVKQYALAGWYIEAVEPDAEVIQTARDYFRLQPGDGTIIESDGRVFLNNTSEAYDLILIDAFGGSAIPYNLLTAEAFAEISNHLTDEGFLALDIPAAGWKDPLLSNITLTLQQTFRNVVALPQEEPPDHYGCVTIMAGKRTLAPVTEPERNVGWEPNWRFGPEYQKTHAWDNRFTPDTRSAKLLTDDRSSLDLDINAINLAAREDLHSSFEKNNLIW
jgi:spermidine synthase